MCKVIKDIGFAKLILVHYGLVSAYDHDEDTKYHPISLLYNKEEDLYELRYELVEREKIGSKKNIPFFME